MTVNAASISLSVLASGDSSVFRARAQHQQVIPTSLPSGLGSFKEGLDLGWIKEVLPPLWVRDTFNQIRAGKVGHGDRQNSARWNEAAGRGSHGREKAFAVNGAVRAVCQRSPLNLRISFIFARSEPTRMASASQLST
jgi:hypothetical protein